MTLAELAPERPAAIVAVGGRGVLAQRLMAMGFLPGAPIRVVGAAPFGDPITVDLDGWRVSLRRSEAAALEVSPAGGAA